jgi:PAS domain S-box-containing protein
MEKRMTTGYRTKGKPRILIVEDEAIIAQDLKWRLEEMGYEVSSVVVTGTEAVNMARKDNPDLVLMDIVLQGDVDGIEAASQIHSNCDIPIVFLTAYADENTLERAKITESFGYLMKPFKNRELQANIEMALYKHKMDRKLKESEGRLFTTLHSINEAVISTDKNGLVTFMNPVAQTLTGWKLEDARGNRFQDIFNINSKETVKDEENPSNRIIQEGIVINQTNYTLINRDEKESSIELSSAPISDEGGSMHGAVVVFHDITERMRIEQELSKYRDHLEELVQERSMKLMKINEQLQQEIIERKQMEKQIKASLKEKEILLSEINHRVGNNLQVIYGMLNIQSNHAEGKQCVDILKGCQNRIMSMSLVHKSLYKSSDVAHIDFSDYIQKLADRLFQIYGIGKDRIALKIDTSDVSLGVETAIPCGLIINELVSNSLIHAFPEERKGEIKITLQPVEKDMYELRISDNGTGIPDDIDFRDTKTLGFQTVVFYEESGPFGKFELDRTNGTEFRIRFKV